MPARATPASSVLGERTPVSSPGAIKVFGAGLVGVNAHQLPGLIQWWLGHRNGDLALASAVAP